MNREVKNIIDTGMTVSQMMEMLGEMQQDAIVFFSCNYGDHSRTQQALPIESIEESEVKYLYDTAYSQSGIALREDQGSEEDDEEYENGEDVRSIVIMK